MKNQSTKILQRGFFIIGFGLTVLAVSGAATSLIVKNNKDQVTNAIEKQAMSKDFTKSILPGDHDSFHGS